MNLKNFDDYNDMLASAFCPEEGALRDGLAHHLSAIIQKWNADSLFCTNHALAFAMSAQC